MAKSKKNNRRKFIVDKAPDKPFESKTHGYNFVNSKFTKLLVVLIIISMTVGVVVSVLVALFNQ